jgi:hypothetical protein
MARRDPEARWNSVVRVLSVVAALVVVPVLIAFLVMSPTVRPEPERPSSSPEPFSVAGLGSGNVELRGSAPCARTALDESYGANVRTGRAQVGDPLLITGTTFRTEGGLWAGASRIEVWWNYDWRSVPMGETKETFILTSFRPRKACRFRLEVTVPPVDPGRYPVQVLVYHGSGWGLFGDRRVSVEP